MSGDAPFSLSDAPHQQGLRLHTTQDKALTLRLMEMGCLPGMQIEKLRTAPAKGLVLIKIHPCGSLLALRYEETQKIIVQRWQTTDNLSAAQQPA